MGQIGGLMFFFGLASIVLYFLNYQLTLLMWIDMWGEAVAWAIRIGLLVVGAALWLIDKKNDSERAQ